MTITRRQILRIAAGLPVAALGGIVIDDPDVDDNPSLEDIRDWCRIFAKAEVDSARMFHRCTWPHQRYTGAVPLWRGIVTIYGYGNPTACRNDRWCALDAIRAAGIEVITYEPSRCGWAWVGFVRAEKEDVEPLIERMVCIKPRYAT